MQVADALDSQQGEQGAIDFTGRSVLATLPFSTPLPQPLTIMIVARARGDVTLVDSLTSRSSRFELCHGYPTADAISRSAPHVCMTACAPLPRPASPPLPRPQPPPARAPHPASPVLRRAHRYGSGETTPGPSHLLRGRTRATNAWHVYTAIYDGDKSELYVDGIREASGKAVGKGSLDGCAQAPEPHATQLLHCVGERPHPPALSLSLSLSLCPCAAALRSSPT